MRLVASASGFSADTVVMGRDAADAFENSPKVLNAFDKKFVEPGVISPKLLQWGCDRSWAMARHPLVCG
jgi:hypothetical protein